MARTRELPSGRFQGLYRDPAGRERSSGGTYLHESDAHRAALDQEALIRHDRWKDPGRGKERFDTFAATWLETKRKTKKPKTYVDYRSALENHVLPYFTGRSLKSIDRMQVQAWMGWCTTEIAQTPSF